METQFKITESEKACVNRRTAAINEFVRSCENIDGYYQYAAANGFSEEEARALVDGQIIPTVNRYNASCREAMEANHTDWILEHITKASEDLNPQAAVRYKLGVLQAIRSLNARVIGTVEEPALTAEEEELLDTAVYTDDMIRSVNLALADAIEHSALPLWENRKFMEFLDENPADQQVSAAVWEMWQDEKVKYAAALSVCVARRQHELPSIPGAISDETLILGACQGMDQAKVAGKMASGELDESLAKKILKTIAVVGLTVLACVVLVKSLALMPKICSKLVIAVFGDNLMALLVGACLVWACVDTLCGMASWWFEKGMQGVGVSIDTVYGVLQKTAAKLNTGLLGDLAEDVRNAIVAVRDFFTHMVQKICGLLNRNKTVTVEA